MHPKAATLALAGLQLWFNGSATYRLARDRPLVGRSYLGRWNNPTPHWDIDMVRSAFGYDCVAWDAIPEHIWDRLPDELLQRATEGA